MTTSRKMEYGVFTVCNLAYLPKALVLAESLARFSPARLAIFLIDRKIDRDFSMAAADLFWIEDMGIPDLPQLAFKYDIIELSTSLKPCLALKLLEQHERVIFFDPDVCLYGSLEPILRDLDGHAIVVTPHYTTPISSHKKPGWNHDLGIMRFGPFNLGFFAVKKSPQGLDFLRWWSDRCLRLGFMESQFGLSTDQKWIGVAPCFFPDLEISFHLGYNAAPWNVFERSITPGRDGGYRVNDAYPLVFFHFSNFDDADPDYQRERSMFGAPPDCPALRELGLAYGQALAAQRGNFPAAAYGFDFMSNGDYISPTLRRAYACLLDEFPAGHDPFAAGGVVGTFARRNHLRERKRRATPKAAIGFQDIEAHESKFKVINFFMRAVLRLLGPTRFNDFSRLLVYLSSYRQNRGLWKF